ncbi:GTP-binding protein gtr2 [Coemansia guatemalensis]|uniref:GTP-binding protein n=1 Tax=Coemansia guatemalensis TaxID=2761395 RepID=A0A9W8LRD7_9FUNG|nr:GTP-binding protein gtr2 [Coemansia guatemalensis]
MNGYGGGGGPGAGNNGIGMYGPPNGLGNTGPAADIGLEAEHTVHNSEEQLAERRVLFMGLPRSGKTSILKVIFEQELAYDTLSLMPTLQRTEHRLITGISVYDFPGIDDFSDSQYSLINPEIYAGEFTSLVFVVDSQSDIQSSLTSLFSVVRSAQSVNPHIPINVFINKVDGLSDELKQDIQHDIQQRVLKNMGYENLNSANVHFLLTTIFNESIREALSKVVQYLVPRNSSLETILNSFCSKSSLDKVFLIDAATKLYLATDSSPTYSPQYVFACQTIDAMDEIAGMCPVQTSEGEVDSAMQRITIGLDGIAEVFIYQINGNLSLFCIGVSQVINQTSLLEFNGSKIAKAIRKILPP